MRAGVTLVSLGLVLAPSAAPLPSATQASYFVGLGEATVIVEFAGTFSCGETELALDIYEVDSRFYATLLLSPAGCIDDGPIVATPLLAFGLVYVLKGSWNTGFSGKALSGTIEIGKVAGETRVPVSGCIACAATIPVYQYSGWVSSLI